MATSIYILDMQSFTKEELECTPCVTFKLNEKEYGIILCDDYYGDDNLEEVLEANLDNNQVKKLAEKIRKKAVQISYEG